MRSAIENFIPQKLLVRGLPRSVDEIAAIPGLRFPSGAAHNAPGMSDASLGAMLASFQRHYSLSYSTVSFIFLVNVAGWLIATPSAPFLLYHIGARTTLILALLLHVFSQLTMTFAPPFWAIVISLLLIGTGSGMIDATVSTYVARLGSEKTVSVLYAFFSVGGLFSPLVVGCILGGNAKWSNYYFVPVGMAALSLIPVWYLFDGYVEPKEEQETTDGDSISIGERYLRALLSGVVIIGGLLTTLGVGTAELLSGWIVSYMANIRQGQESSMRYVLSGFWAGHALGRFLLPFLPMSLRCSVPIFLIFIFGLSTIFQFVPDMAGDAIAVAFAGFFLGPIAPAALSIVSGHVPKPLLSATVSILMSFGLVGSVLAPVLMGVASSAGGLRYLPATVMGAAVTLSVIWTIAELSWRKADANGGKASTEADSDSLD